MSSIENTETDAWAELQALKLQRESRRRKLEERKKGLLGTTGSSGTFSSEASATGGTGTGDISSSGSGDANLSSTSTGGTDSETSGGIGIPIVPGAGTQPPYSKEDEEELENLLLKSLCDAALNLPIDSKQLYASLVEGKEPSTRRLQIKHEQLCNLLQKFSVQKLIKIEKKISGTGDLIIEVISAEHTKLTALVESLVLPGSSKKRKIDNDDDNETDRTEPITSSDRDRDTKKSDPDDVLSLLSMDSTKERENKRIGEEILELLSRPTAKEKNLAEQFRSQGGTSVREFCPHGTKVDCRKVSANNRPCSKVHFRKIIQSHTDESLGDCSFLNTCFHMESCKYVHYEVDKDTIHLTTAPSTKRSGISDGSEPNKSKTVLHPAQWVHCDLRYFDMTVLGKFSVIMADPPWDIHMELPYGTLSDDEMRQLNIPSLQDDGLIFLWVTGRAMELGRECLQLWGYERVDELIWVKTNQLQRIIRTGRTGHWLNHGKEHCLVGMKGNPQINRGFDADIIVAEVRATSHKPDEVYGIIERLSPGTRKIELFGRPHNIQPNWVTLGNQLEGSHIVDEEVRKRFFIRYPDGNCLQK